MFSLEKAQEYQFCHHHAPGNGGQTGIFQDPLPVCQQGPTFFPHQRDPWPGLPKQGVRDDASRPLLVGRVRLFRRAGPALLPQQWPAEVAPVRHLSSPSPVRPPPLSLFPAVGEPGVVAGQRAGIGVAEHARGAAESWQWVFSCGALVTRFCTFCRSWTLYVHPAIFFPCAHRMAQKNANIVGGTKVRPFVRIPDLCFL